MRSAAAQQQVCGPYSDMTAKLGEYGEALSGRGIDAVNRMLEIWAGPDGWTVILVRPNDMMSCVMLIGQKRHAVADGRAATGRPKELR